MTWYQDPLPNSSTKSLFSNKGISTVMGISTWIYHFRGTPFNPLYMCMLCVVVCYSFFRTLTAIKNWAYEKITWSNYSRRLFSENSESFLLLEEILALMHEHLLTSHKIICTLTNGKWSWTQPGGFSCGKRFRTS